MAVPKKKTSHRKQHQRRAHWKAQIVEVVACSQCGMSKRPHQVCTNCGYYRGRPASNKQ